MLIQMNFFGKLKNFKHILNSILYICKLNNVIE